MMREIYFIYVITGIPMPKGLIRLRKVWVGLSCCFFVKMGLKRCWEDISEESITQRSNTKWQYMYLT